MNKAPTQSSQLLPRLFQQVDEESRLSVLHIGPAFQDTVEFFAGFRCRLHVIDLFSELPIPPAEATDQGLEAWFRELLPFADETRFDICLFWDLFNFLDAAALSALLAVLQPCLKPDSLAHGFSVHNTRSPQSQQLYGIRQADTLSIRKRGAALPGYAPHSQQRLKELLPCFQLERSVLLPDSRLELLLRTRRPRD